MRNVRVKICGIKNEEDLHMCVKSGVDALGFVVEYPVEVPWNITREKAFKLIQKVPPFVTTVAVVGGEVDKILAIADFTMPDVVQLHGDEPFHETSILVRELKKRGIRVIKALRISIDEDVKIEDTVEDAQKLVEVGISALLLDSKTNTMPAGTGMPFSWEIAKQVQKKVKVPLIIAGGLNSENVRDVVDSISPFGVDVISGVEAEPGKKDEYKVRSFIESVKNSNRTRICTDYAER